MPDFTPVSPGQPLRIDAKTWNRIQEAARGFDRSRLGGGTTGTPQGIEVNPANLVLVRNDTGAKLPEFSVLSLGAPVISAVDFPNQVRRQPVWSGATPGATAATDPFVITIEPIGVSSDGTGEVGRAVILGEVVCNVVVHDNAHGYAAPAAGVSLTLSSAVSGPARILWREVGSSGTKRAVVLISPGGGPTATQCVKDGDDVALSYLASVCIGKLTLPTAGAYLLYAKANGFIDPVSAFPEVSIGMSCRVGTVGGISIPGTFTTVCSSFDQKIAEGSGSFVIGYLAASGPLDVLLVADAGNWGYDPGSYRSVADVIFGFVPLSMLASSICLPCGSGSGSGSGSGGGGGQDFIAMGDPVTATVSGGTGGCTCLNGKSWVLHPTSSTRWDRTGSDGDFNDLACAGGINPEQGAWLRWRIPSPPGSVSNWEVGGLYDNIDADITFVSQNAATKTVVLQVKGTIGVGSSVCTGTFVITFQGT